MPGQDRHEHYTFSAVGQDATCLRAATHVDPRSIVPVRIADIVPGQTTGSVQFQTKRSGEQASAADCHPRNFHRNAGNHHDRCANRPPHPMMDWFTQDDASGIVLRAPCSQHQTDHDRDAHHSTLGRIRINAKTRIARIIAAVRHHSLTLFVGQGTILSTGTLISR